AGGAVANVAVGLARLGVEAAFLGKVGEDPFGHFLERTLSAAGVDTRFLVFDPEHRTGLAFVSLPADGERDFVFFRNPSADMLHRPEEVPDAALEGCRVFHFGSISLIQEPSRSATLATLARARQRGALVSFDPNLRAPLWPNLEAARRQMLAAIPLADLVKVSEEEAGFLYGPGSLEDHAGRLLASGPCLVAITRGESGSYLAMRGASAAAPGLPVECVDATGAGDGFVAGLLACILERSGPDNLTGDDLARIGRFANAVGALTCTRKGAINALPTRQAVDALLAGVR
ncbi:MAG TPA: carbohydrate kinase, partial [Armatimonadota bacterium]|nr:carbohydrate kinase [Armatimonadota bacterium]